MFMAHHADYTTDTGNMYDQLVGLVNLRKCVYFAAERIALISKDDVIHTCMKNRQRRH